MKLLTVFSATLVCILSLQSCSNNKFQGYVYAESKPLSNVCITDDEGKMTMTDSLGYFVLNKDSNYFTDYLVFSKSGYKTDTIPTVQFIGSLQSIEKFKTLQDTVRLSPIAQEMNE